MKICILAAGRGTRMGRYSYIHKGLLPLDNKAILSHIIQYFGENNDYIIALGDRKTQIKDFIAIAHPDLRVTYIEVKNYDGPGSGPGASLYACKDRLQEPFLFTACDTLLGSNLPAETNCNWIGVRKVNDSEKWCSVDLDAKKLVTKIYYKEKVKTPWAFIGIGYVKDYKEFWTGFTHNHTLLQNELQVNNGLEALIPKKLKGITMKWLDAGNKNNYEDLLTQHNNLTFLGKNTDVTYAYGKKIIKFFEDEQVTKRRYKRGLANKGVFAAVDKLQGSFYDYAFIPGKLLSAEITYETYSKFLNWMETKFWKQKEVNTIKFNRTIKEFYLEKTKKRLQSFVEENKVDWEHKSLWINGIHCPSVKTLLKKMEDHVDGMNFLPSSYHGDLHDNNVIVTEKGYTLIDWRDSFGDFEEIGDRYYDLAKFLHTLVFSVEVMNNGDFQISEGNDIISINHANDFNHMEAEHAFRDFVKKNGYSSISIDIVQSIIFINMSPLYSGKLSHYLYLLGRYMLQKSLRQILL